MCIHFVLACPPSRPVIGPLPQRWQVHWRGDPHIHGGAEPRGWRGRTLAGGCTKRHRGCDLRRPCPCGPVQRQVYDHGADFCFHDRCPVCAVAAPLAWRSWLRHQAIASSRIHLHAGLATRPFVCAHDNEFRCACMIRATARRPRLRAPRCVRPTVPAAPTLALRYEFDGHARARAGSGHVRREPHNQRAVGNTVRVRAGVLPHVSDLHMALRGLSAAVLSRCTTSCVACAHTQTTSGRRGAPFPAPPPVCCVRPTLLALVSRDHAKSMP